MARKPRAKRKPLYSIWEGMRARCYNPKCRVFHLYGARGIHMCDSWKDSFETFLSDMAPRPSPKHSIDRIDNDGPYSPENCRWADQRTQTRNKRGIRWVTIDGNRYKAVELAEKVGIKTDTLVARVNCGLSFAEVMSPEHRKNLTGLAIGGHASGAKQQARTHCNHGHEFTLENTSLTAKGWRRCKECCRRRTNTHRLKKIAA